MMKLHPDILGLAYFASAIIISTTYHKFRKLATSVPIVTFGNDPSLQILDAVMNVEVLQAPVSLTAVAVLDFHGQFQTILASFSRSLIMNPVIVSNRQILEINDGGHVALDWLSLAGTDANSSSVTDSQQPVIIMCHGLCGSSESDYIVHTAEMFLRHGYRVAVLIARGCAGLPLNTPVGFNGARTSDIEAAVELVCKMFPKSKVFAIGYSLGAGILMNYVGNHRTVPLTAACCICPPWDMRHATPTSVFPLWSFVLSLALKGYLWANRHVLAAPTDPAIDMRAVMLAPTVRVIDEHLVHMHGYDSVDDYYKNMSSAFVAKYVTVPTLAISAEDDPCCTIYGCPDINHHVSDHHKHTHQDHSNFSGQGQINCSDNIGSGLVVVRTVIGGHLGFLESLLNPRADWSDRAALQWLEQFR